MNDLDQAVAEFSTKVEKHVDSVFDSQGLRESGMSYDQFREWFTTHSYGKMVQSKWENDESFIKRYFSLGDKDNGGSLDAGEFFWASALYLTEGALVAGNQHPKLSPEGVTGSFSEGALLKVAALSMFNGVQELAESLWKWGDNKVSREDLWELFTNSDENGNDLPFRLAALQNGYNEKYERVVGSLLVFYDFGGDGVYSKNTFLMLMLNYSFRQAKYLAQL